MGFNSFVGNAKVVDRLRAKLSGGRFPHGLIFAGPEGVGKRTLALSLAKALNCETSRLMDFCGACPQCHKVDAGTHPDVHTIAVPEDRSEISVAQIREAMEMMRLGTMEGATRVFIFDPAQQLNRNSANALLKGLEEPPPNTVFVLIVPNVHDLPITIRSRCQVYPFASLPLDEIRRNGVTDEVAVRWSQGSIGRARSIDVVALKEQREDLLVFLESAAGGNDAGLRDMFAHSAAMGRDKEGFAETVATLAVIAGDLVRLDNGRRESIVNFDIVSRMEQLVAKMGSERILALAQMLGRVERALNYYGNRQILADAIGLEASGAGAGSKNTE